MVEPGILNEEMKSNSEMAASEELTSSWGEKLIALVCERCDWRYLLPNSDSQSTCPHCFQSILTPINQQVTELPYIKPPELLVPFSLSQDSLSRSLLNFSKGIPFSPADITTNNLRNRMNMMYIPKWLVDAQVKATWNAETGFNYQVVSHQDRYDQNRGGWSSQEVEETRVRWEPRLGRLDRKYDNLPAPALEEHKEIIASLGEFDPSASVPYKKELLERSLIHLPDRTPQDAWNDARAQLQILASEECRQAAGADHIRQFFWEPEFGKQNWTLLLLPVISTFYLDDEGKPQAIMINGQSGQISGSRRASMKRAQRAALTVVVVAVIIFLIGLLLSAASLFLPALLVFGVIGLVIALVVGLGAVIPIATVWWFNRSQSILS